MAMIRSSRSHATDPTRSLATSSLTALIMRRRYWLKSSILKKAVSAVYVDGESKQYMVKRFMIETTTQDKEFGFISESIGSRLVLVTTSETPEIELEVSKEKIKLRQLKSVNLEEIIDVKGWKALGNRLSRIQGFEGKPCSGGRIRP